MKLLENTYRALVVIFGMIFAAMIAIFFMMLTCGCATAVGDKVYVGVSPISPCVKVCESPNCEHASTACASDDNKVVGPVLIMRF